ncbi:MAG: DoxX family protein [Bacteroidia bacterium]|nr:DoxX family protein [Bacteroidia bacterium]
METYKIIGISYAVLGLLVLIWLIIEKSRKKTWDLEQLPVSNTLIFILRFFVGLLFIYSGFIKANDYTGFAYKLEEYFEVFAKDMPFLEGFFLGMMKPLSMPLAWFLSVFEIALGVAIIVGYKMRVTMWLTLLLMIFFTFLTGYSALPGLSLSPFAWNHDLMKVTDCGCFGDALKLKPQESFYKDLILLLAILPAFLTSRYIRPLVSNKFAGVSSILSFVLAGAFAYGCYQFLPLIDYRPYKIGVELPKCTVESENGEPPKCKDWDEVYRLNLAGNDTIPDETVKTAAGNDSVVKYHVFQRPGKDTVKVDEFKGNVLMIIMYNMQKTDEKNIRQTIDLYNKLQGSGVGVMGMTGTGKSDLYETFLPEYKIPYQISLRDMTMLKTIVRSNPGYMLLKDGKVVKKWHYNLPPTEGEIKSLLK